MSKPANILNQKKDADRTLDKRIKRGVFIVVGFTWFYLYAGGGLKEDPDKKDPEKVITIFDFLTVNLTEQKFLYILLILTALVCMRLIYRIGISRGYNHYYDSAEKKYDEKYSTDESCDYKKRKEEIEKSYKEKAECLTFFDKYIIGLGIPVVIASVTIIWLVFKIGQLSCPTC